MEQDIKRQWQMAENTRYDVQCVLYVSYRIDTHNKRGGKRVSGDSENRKININGQIDRQMNGQKRKRGLSSKPANQPTSQKKTQSNIKVSQRNTRNGTSFRSLYVHQFDYKSDLAHRDQNK